jgi:hypothetical protein
MKSRYEKLVNQFSPNWVKGDKEERDGGIGMAIVVAYIDGCRPRLSDFARYLGLEISELKDPFDKLLYAGIFSQSFNARKDRALNGDSTRSEGLNAWGYIYGIAAGLIYRSLNNICPKTNRQEL